MRRLFAGLCLVLLMCTTAMAVQPKWPTFKGAWFEVKYPSGFSVRRSLQRASSTDSCDSAFFKSPDGAVEFYVFSPQWNGNPTDIAINPQTEKYIAQSAGTVKGIRTIRVTIKAKNGSYLRSFVDVENKTENTRLVFGIKYKTQKAYAKCKSDYIKFKGSLTQYGD